MVFNCREISRTLAHAQEKALNRSQAGQPSGGSATNLKGAITDAVKGDRDSVSRSSQNSSVNPSSTTSDKVLGRKI